jgi:hypothetical protein
MPTGPGGLDANGVWQYGEDDTEALASDLLNLGMGSVSTVVGGLGAPIILQVLSVNKTDTFTASVTAGASVAITGLSITHAMASASNRLIISAFCGGLASTSGLGETGIAVHDGTDLILIGDASSSKPRVTAGGLTTGTGSTFLTTFPSFTFVHSPGTTASQTYTLRAINTDSTTETIFVNRTEDDGATRNPRAASSLVIQEVAA